MMALYVGNNTAIVGESNKWAVVLGRHGFLNSFKLFCSGSELCVSDIYI